MFTAVCLAVLAADPVRVETGVFGQTAAGEDVASYTLTNDAGFSATLITLGATIQALHVPDANGETADVVLGFDDVAGYESGRNPYFGCTVGRFANRIRNATFQLDGQTHRVTANAGPHHIHGGGAGALSKKNWTGRVGKGRNGNGVVVFTCTSPDGEEGFPGNLKTTVRYSLEADANALSISYTATTDAPTPVNLTNHSYFNLAGHDAGAIVDHRLKVNADSYTVWDDARIPTGEIASVDGTPYDFRKPRPLGKRFAQTDADGYDINYILDENASGDPPTDDAGRAKLVVAAVAVDSDSGRVMICSTTEPGVQLYTGNGLRDIPGKDGATYQPYAGFCLETQHYPDAINQPDFPSPVITPEKPFESRTRYAFRVQKNAANSDAAK